MPPQSRGWSGLRPKAPYDGTHAGAHNQARLDALAHKLADHADVRVAVQRAAAQGDRQASGPAASKWRRVVLIMMMRPHAPG